jgi:hypothetical protein
VFGSQPFFDEAICCKGLRAPRGNHETVVDNYIRYERSPEALLVLQSSITCSLMGSMADFSIMTICERSRALADGKVVLEGQIRGNVDFESHCKRAGELHLQEWPRPACYIAVATFRTRLMARQGRTLPVHFEGGADTHPPGTQRGGLLIFLPSQPSPSLYF